MINLLVQSAFQTGWVSVASESLMRQLIEQHLVQPAELSELKALYQAVATGQVRRESLGDWQGIFGNPYGSTN